MNMKSFVVKIAVLTVVSFGVSYFVGSFGSDNAFEIFPVAVAKKYSQAVDEPFETFEVVKSLEAASVQKLRIEAVLTDIKIETGPVEKVTLKLKGKYPSSLIRSEKLILVENKDNELYIKIQDEDTERASSFFSFNDNSKGELILTIPEKIKNLELRTVSGDIKAKGTLFSETDFITVSGDVKIENLKSQLLKVTTVSGDINAEIESEQVKLLSVSGNIKIKSVLNTANIELKATSGELELLFKNHIDSNVDFSSVSGEIEGVDKLQLNKSSGYEKLPGHVSFKQTLGSGKGTLKAHTVSGDLKVGIY